MALYALGWGLVAGSAALIGALIGWFVRPPPRLIALLLAFASGILLSVAAFELFDEAFAHGGFLPTAFGFLIGAGLFALGLAWFDRRGARHRKHSAEAVVAGRDAAGIVALATVIDGVPEALIIGINFYDGTGLGIATVIAVFLSNIPESLSSTARMRTLRRSPSYVACVWIAVAIATGLAAFAGYTLLGDLPPGGKAILQAMAGGAFLVYIANAVIPEAFAETRDLTGLALAVGFLTGYSLSEFLG
jgi:zinc transporter, ZIP family